MFEWPWINHIGIEQFWQRSRPNARFYHRHANNRRLTSKRHVQTNQNVPQIASNPDWRKLQRNSWACTPMQLVQIIETIVGLLLWKREHPRVLQSSNAWFIYCPRPEVNKYKWVLWYVCFWDERCWISRLLQYWKAVWECWAAGVFQ